MMDMLQKNAPIAVFDSGLGGISVLKELIALMPGENYLYFGDSANAPYGNRPTAQVRQLTLDAAHSLLARGAKALVIACNTATSAAIAMLRQEFPDKIIVGIEPALKVAADRFPTGHIGVMATQVTLREEKFAHQLERFPQARVSLIPAPGLVERVEAGEANAPQTVALLQSILGIYAGTLDALVLGCTHYPFAKAAIRQVLGEDVLLLDGGPGTARQTQRLLANAGLLHNGPGSVNIENSSPDPAILQRANRMLVENSL